MSLGCGDWTIIFFAEFNLYTAIGFWWRDIGFIFVLTSFEYGLFAEHLL